MRALFLLPLVAACGVTVVGVPVPDSSGNSTPSDNAITSPDAGGLVPLPGVPDGAAPDANADAGRPTQADMTGIFDVDVVLNGTNGNFDLQTDFMDNSKNVYVTQTVAVALKGGDTGRKGLPDDAFFPANADHQAVQLGWRNDNDGFNAKRLFAGSAIQIFLPAGPYGRLVVYGASGGSSSKLDITAEYQDGTSTHIQVKLEDWDHTGSASGLFPLISGMDRAKVDGNASSNGTNYSVWGAPLEVDPKPLRDVLLHDAETSSNPLVSILGVSLE